MKKNLLSILAVGVGYFALTLLYELFFGKLDSVRILTGAVSSILFGVVFIGGMNLLKRWLFAKLTIDVAEGEKIIKVDGANHFKNGEGVGGKLLLSDRRLAFKSHRYNVQNHEESFDLARIKTASQRKTWHIFDNGLLLELDNGDVHKFVVSNSNDWTRLINQQLSRVAWQG